METRSQPLLGQNLDLVDHGGLPYTVEVWMVLEAPEPDDWRDTGVRELRLAPSGEIVTQVDADSYRIEETGKLLRRKP